MVLPCGHYLCHACFTAVQEEMKSKEGGYMCVFGKGSETQCYSNPSTKDEIEKLPVAHHIRELLDAFYQIGIHCHYCTKPVKSSMKGDEMGKARTVEDWPCEKYLNDYASRKLSLRFPRELMVCCTHADCIKHEKLNKASFNFDNAEKRRKKYTIDPYSCDQFFFAVVPICMFCAKSAHKMHLSYLKPIDLVFDEKKVTDKIKEDWKKREDRDQGSRTFYDQWRPWHLAMLKTDKMIKLTKELLVCQRCIRAYKPRERIPVILDCGHLVCSVCEKFIREMNPNIKLREAQCKRVECLEKERHKKEKGREEELRSPEDLDYLLNLDISDYKKCSCNNVVSPDHWV